MGSKLCVRITSTEPFGFAQIVNAETGEVIPGISHVSIDMPAGGLFVATFTAFCEVDVVAEVAEADDVPA